MFGFLKKILGISSKDSSINESDDDNFNINREKKNNFTNIESTFYVHTEPDKITRMMMPVNDTIILNQTINNITDEQGNPVDMNSVEMEKHKPGVFVKGIGWVGGPPEKKAPAQTSQTKGAPHGTSVPISGTSTNIPINSSMSIAPYEIILTSESYHLYVDLAGVKKESVGLTFNDSTLSISGKRISMVDEWKSMSKGKGKKHTVDTAKSYVPSILMGSFEFKYPFKKSIDETSISAEFSDGLLHVTLPLRAKTNVAIAII